MRIALGIEYFGASYCGWQSQPTGVAVQCLLERAINKVAAEKVKVICSGRTDKGVHAKQQVAHFDTNAYRPVSSWLLGINSNLPDDIKVVWLKPITDAFHARFSAVARVYHYYIYNRSISSAIYAKHAYWCYKKLDIIALNKAASYLVGEHDFSSFRSRGCHANSTIKVISEFYFVRRGSFIVAVIRGNSFLYNMVRNMMGSLLEVGCGNYDPSWILSVLHAKDRSKAKNKIAAHGLYFMAAEYRVDLLSLEKDIEYVF